MALISIFKVQLVANPLIAFLSKKFTLPLILLIGSLNIFLCSLSDDIFANNNFFIELLN